MLKIKKLFLFYSFSIIFYHFFFISHSTGHKSHNLMEEMDSTA